MEREKDRSEGDFQPNSHKCQKLAFLFKLLCLICCGRQVTQNVFRINFCIFAYVDIENPQCCWGSDQSLRKGGKFSNVPNKILSIMEVIQHQEEQTTWAADTGAAATCIQSCGQVRRLSGSFGSLRWDSAMKHPSFPSVSLLSLSTTTWECSCCKIQGSTCSQTAAALPPQVHHEVSWSVHSQQGCAGAQQLVFANHGNTKYILKGVITIIT